MRGGGQASRLELYTRTYGDNVGHYPQSITRRIHPSGAFKRSYQRIHIPYYEYFLLLNKGKEGMWTTSISHHGAEFAKGWGQHRLLERAVREPI